jgi:ribonuclease HI
MFINKTESQSLKFHLGPLSKHTVYEAELVGLSLALRLLLSLPYQIRSCVIIGIDSQAAIKALSNQRPHPAHYLLDHIHDYSVKLHDKLLGNANLQIHWTPCHRDFAPNERADAQAKQAALGSSSTPSHLPFFLCNSTLPSSIPA